MPFSLRHYAIEPALYVVAAAVGGLLVSHCATDLAQSKVNSVRAWFLIMLLCCLGALRMIPFYDIHGWLYAMVIAAICLSCTVIWYTLPLLVFGKSA
jgi:hypothetical protein